MKAKKRAHQTNRTLIGVIEDSLRQTLTGTPPCGAPAHKLALVAVRGGLLPGVDISDRDSLYERMEGRS